MCVRKNLVIFRQPKDKKFRYSNSRVIAKLFMLGYYAVMSNFSQQTIRLLDQVRNVLRLEHYSYRTEEAYV